MRVFPLIVAALISISSYALNNSATAIVTGNLSEVMQSWKNFAQERTIHVLTESNGVVFFREATICEKSNFKGNIISTIDEVREGVELSITYQPTNKYNHAVSISEEQKKLLTQFLNDFILAHDVRMNDPFAELYAPSLKELEAALENAHKKVDLATKQNLKNQKALSKLKNKKSTMTAKGNSDNEVENQITEIELLIMHNREIIAAQTKMIKEINKQIDELMNSLND